MEGCAAPEVVPTAFVVNLYVPKNRRPGVIPRDVGIQTPEPGISSSNHDFYFVRRPCGQEVLDANRHREQVYEVVPPVHLVVVAVVVVAESVDPVPERVIKGIVSGPDVVVDPVVETVGNTMPRIIIIEYAVAIDIRDQQRQNCRQAEFSRVGHGTTVVDRRERITQGRSSPAKGDNGNPGVATRGEILRQALPYVQRQSPPVFMDSRVQQQRLLVDFAPQVELEAHRRVDELNVNLAGWQIDIRPQVHHRSEIDICRRHNREAKI